MDIFLDSTSTKRIDLSLDYSTYYYTKERRFVIRSGNSVVSFENFLEAVDYYRGLK